jgi:hypothetical protein
MLKTVEKMADNSIGTWKLNVAKSDRPTPSPNPATSVHEVIEAVEGGVKVTVTGQRQDGSAINFTSTIIYDGKEHPVVGAPHDIFDTVSAKQIDPNTFTLEETKQGGKFHAAGRIVISQDGKTMMHTLKGTDSNGNPISATTIYDIYDSV